MVSNLLFYVIFTLLFIQLHFISAQRRARRENRPQAGNSRGSRGKRNRAVEAVLNAARPGHTAEDALYNSKGIRQFKKTVNQIDETTAALTVYGTPPMRMLGYSRLGAHSSLISRGPQFISPSSLKPAIWPTPMAPTRKEMIQFSRSQMEREMLQKKGDYQYMEAEPEFGEIVDFGDEQITSTLDLKPVSFVKEEPKPSFESSLKISRVDEFESPPSSSASQFNPIAPMPIQEDPVTTFPAMTGSQFIPNQNQRWNKQRYTKLNPNGLIVSHGGRILSSPTINSANRIASTGFGRAATSPMRMIVPNPKQRTRRSSTIMRFFRLRK